MALFYDSGTEMRWTSGFSLALSAVEATRPTGSNLAGATPRIVGLAQFPLLGAREAADAVFTESFGTGGRFFVLQKDGIGGIQPGDYLLSVPELPGTSANFRVRP